MQVYMRREVEKGMMAITLSVRASRDGDGKDFVGALHCWQGFSCIRGRHKHILLLEEVTRLK